MGPFPGGAGATRFSPSVTGREEKEEGDGKLPDKKPPALSISKGTLSSKWKTDMWRRTSQQPPQARSVMLSPSPHAKAVLGEKAPKEVRSELGKKFYPCWSSEFPEAPDSQGSFHCMQGARQRAEPAFLNADSHHCWKRELSFRVSHFSAEF